MGENVLLRIPRIQNLSRNIIGQSSETHVGKISEMHDKKKQEKKNQLKKIKCPPKMGYS